MANEDSVGVLAESDLPKGYRFAGVHCGVRADRNRPDLALVISDWPAAAAGVFTQNRVTAAPVRLCRQRLPAERTRGVVVCAGNANACTGQQGLKDAGHMAALTAQMIECRPDQILVCSTGVIGQPLPMDRINEGIRAAALELAGGAAAFDRAAHAILTTDTKVKISARCVDIGGTVVRLTGFAKGAAMIGPNMATMLAFVLTDAPLSAGHLATLAPKAADHTFNCISVEGHTSTNDTLLFFANGRGGHLEGESAAQFNRAATEVCADLARAIAADAEGASHLIRIQVRGLPSFPEARQVAKTVAESLLFKTAIFGGDPNWGRIVSAAGYAGVPFEEQDLSLWIGDMLLYRAGAPQPFDLPAASAYLKNYREVHIRLFFTLGEAEASFWTSDLGYDYIRLNAEYTT
jgi:glutamate N-acetyltransferase/amino-acid N-acetyltransferase